MQRPESPPRELPSFFDAAPALLLVVAADAPRFTLLAATDAYLAATGRPRAGLIGRGVAEALEPAAVEDARAALARAIAGRCAVRAPLRRHHAESAEGRRDGPAARYRQPVITPILDAGGEVACLVYQLDDVTDAVRLESLQAVQHQSDSALSGLREREERFRTLADAIPQLVWSAYADGNIYWYNRRWYEYTGTTLQEVAGWGWQSVHDPAELPAVLSRWRASIAGGEPFEMDFSLRGADGRFRRFLTRVVPVRAADGHLLQWFGTNTDVEDAQRAAAERQRLFDALQAEKECLSLVLNSITDEVYFIDTRQRYTLANAAAVREFAEASIEGMSVTEVLGKRTILRADGTPRPLAEAPTLRALAGETVQNEEVRVLTPHGGQPRHRQVNSAPVRDSRGTIIGAVSTVRDITEQKRAEAAIRESEARLRAMFDDAATPMSMSRIDGSLVQVNRAFSDLLGYGGEELLRADCPALTHPEDRAALEEGQRRLLAGEIRTFRMEKRYLHRAGHAIWCDSNVALVSMPDGAAAGFVTQSYDITGKRIAQRQLLDRERQFMGLANAIPQLAYTESATGKPEYFNRRWYAYTGLTEQESLSGTGWNRVLHPDDAAQTGAKWRSSMQSGAPYEAECRLRRHDGVYRWFLVRAAADRDALGAVIQWFGTGTDIDAAKQIEENLRRTEAALREANERKDVFLATLSHELRNPLAPIRTAARLLGSADLSPADTLSARSIIARQVSQMASLLDDLLDVSRFTRGTLTLKKERIPLRQVLDAAIEAATPMLDARRHRLDFVPPDASLCLDADPVRLTQVVSNLLMNAAKYTPPGGRITLKAGQHDSQVVIAVADTGIGLAPEMFAQVFEMFAQVRADSDQSQGGLGIGLALVKAVVELHGGRVEVDSAGLDRGSTFSVILPAAAVLPEVGRDRGDAAEPLRATARRVVIADDNRDGAESLSMLLQVAGHEVEVAHDGLEALELLARVRPEVAIIDIGMPGADGYEVARRVRGADWGSRITLIALTGWGQDGDRGRAREAGFDHHLTKPADPGAIERLLGVAAGR